MSEQHPQLSDVPKPSALLVAQYFADYLKSLALYPAGNPRVAANCTRVMEAVREAISSSDTGPDFRFVFQGNDYVAGELRQSCSELPRLAWLRERFDRCALAGLAIRRDADEEALSLFAARFLDIVRQRPKNPQFDDFWEEESMLGIEPLERRYDGQYEIGQEADKGEIAEWLLQGSDGSQLLSEMLRRSGKIAQRIHSIEDRLRLIASERKIEEGVEVDVLAQVLKTLPLEVLGDGPAIVKVVSEVLQRLEESIANSALETGSVELGKLLGSISRRFFALTEESQATAAEVAKQKDGERAIGHAGDEKIIDDSDAMLAELAELPKLENLELSEDGEEQLGEIFAVYLAFLVRVDEPLALTRIRRLLRGLLSREEPVFSAVAANFLTWCEAQAEENDDWTAFDRFVDLVEDAGCPELLTELGQLELGSLVQRFPRTFFTFIDGIDPRRNSDDSKKLQQLLELIDPDRVKRAQQELIRGLDKKERGEKILALSRERILPFMHILIGIDRERWIPVVARSLASIPTELAEQGIFKLMAPEDMPHDWVALYLRALSEASAKRTLRVRSAEILADFLDASAFDDAQLELRTWTVQLLGKLPCTGSAKALHRILTRKKRLGLRKEDPSLREAAQRAINALELALSPSGARRV